MADLITSARAKYNINQASFSGAEDTTLAALISAVSKAIQRYCRREFTSQSFDRLYCGPGGKLLLLDEYPIQSVARVAGSPSTVLEIANTSSTNQRATVAVTSTGLTLMRVTSGSSSTDTSVTWAGNATVQAVANAVNALGNGWSARVADSNYALWPSADLRAPQGGLDAKGGGAPLRIHVEDLDDYEIGAPWGCLTRTGGAIWSAGCDNYRVIFTAGYSTVPEDVQEACAQWVAALFWQTKDNPAVYPELPSHAVTLLLDHYRRHGV